MWGAYAAVHHGCLRIAPRGSLPGAPQGLFALEVLLAAEPRNVGFRDEVPAVGRRRKPWRRSQWVVPESSPGGRDRYGPLRPHGRPAVRHRLEHAWSRVETHDPGEPAPRTQNLRDQRLSSQGMERDVDGSLVRRLSSSQIQDAREGADRWSAPSLKWSSAPSAANIHCCIRRSCAHCQLQPLVEPQPSQM